MTPDPYGGSTKPNEPLTWNRYGYVLDDPANSIDPTGLDDQCEVALCGPDIGGIGFTFDLGQILDEMQYINFNSPDELLLLSNPLTSITVTCPPSCGNDSGAPSPFESLLNLLVFDFSVTAPIPGTGPIPLLGIQADVTYIRRSRQLCASVGLALVPTGAIGAALILFQDPFAAAPNIVPGFSVGLNLQPTPGVGLAATGSFGQPVLVGASIGFKGVGISSSWGSCMSSSELVRRNDQRATFFAGASSAGSVGHPARTRRYQR